MGLSAVTGGGQCLELLLFVDVFNLHASSCVNHENPCAEQEDLKVLRFEESYYCW
jgi:hypothetical protein